MLDASEEECHCAHLNGDCLLVRHTLPDPSRERRVGGGPLASAWEKAKGLALSKCCVSIATLSSQELAKSVKCPGTLFACRLVCRHWRDNLSPVVEEVAWRALESVARLQATLQTFPGSSSFTVIIPSDPLLLTRPGLVDSVASLVQHCGQERIHALAVHGPKVRADVLERGAP